MGTSSVVLVDVPTLTPRAPMSSYTSYFHGRRVGVKKWGRVGRRDETWMVRGGSRKIHTNRYVV